MRFSRSQFCFGVKAFNYTTGKAYSGQKETLREHAPNAKDFTNKKGCRNRLLTDEDKSKNSTKSSVRAKVEHIFRIMKCQFGFTKLRFRGLDKNATYLFTNCALINLVLSKNRLLRLTQA